MDQVLQPLRPDGTRHFLKALFDYRRDQPAQSRRQTATEDAIVLFDGIFLLRRQLRSHWDLSIYLDVSAEESLRRALTRDMALFGSREVAEMRYRMRYLPGQALYRREAKPTEVCDIRIDLNMVERPVVLRDSGR